MLDGHVTGPLFYESSSHRLTSMWWGCCSLCLWLKPADVFDINQLSFPSPFCSVLISVSVFIALSTVSHSINSPDNSPLFFTLFFHSSFWLIGPFNYITVYESLLQPWYNPLWLTGLKAPTNKLANYQSWLVYGSYNYVQYFSNRKHKAQLHCPVRGAKCLEMYWAYQDISSSR